LHTERPSLLAFAKRDKSFARREEKNELSRFLAEKECFFAHRERSVSNCRGWFAIVTRDTKCLGKRSPRKETQKRDLEKRKET